MGQYFLVYFIHCRVHQSLKLKKSGMVLDLFLVFPLSHSHLIPEVLSMEMENIFQTIVLPLHEKSENNYQHDTIN